MRIAQPPTCDGCAAQVRHSTIYQPGHEMDDGTGHVNLCHILQEQGRCQVQLGARLIQEQVAALNNLADAIGRNPRVLEVLDE